MGSKVSSLGKRRRDDAEEINNNKHENEHEQPQEQTISPSKRQKNSHWVDKIPQQGSDSVKGNNRRPQTEFNIPQAVQDDINSRMGAFMKRAKVDRIHHGALDDLCAATLSHLRENLDRTVDLTLLSAALTKQDGSTPTVNKEPESSEVETGGLVNWDDLDSTSYEGCEGEFSDSVKSEWASSSPNLILPANRFVYIVRSLVSKDTKMKVKTLYDLQRMFESHLVFLANLSHRCAEHRDSHYITVVDTRLALSLLKKQNI